MKDKARWVDYIDVLEIGYVGAEGYFWAGRGKGDPFPPVAVVQEDEAEAGQCKTDKASTGANHYKSLQPTHPDAPTYYALLNEPIPVNMGATSLPHAAQGYYLTKQCRQRLDQLAAGTLQPNNGPPCVPFVHPNPGWAAGSMEATTNNLNLPLNITYAGRTTRGMLDIIMDRHQRGVATMFYWWTPDPFFSELQKEQIPFTKIHFPTFNTLDKALGDGTPDGGESCDFVIANMETVIRKDMKTYAPEVYALVSSMRLTQTDITALMLEHLRLSNTPETKEALAMATTNLATNAQALRAAKDQVLMAAATHWVNHNQGKKCTPYAVCDTV